MSFRTSVASEFVTDEAGEAGEGTHRVSRGNHERLQRARRRAADVHARQREAAARDARGRALPHRLVDEVFMQPGRTSNVPRFASFAESISNVEIKPSIWPFSSASDGFGVRTVRICSQ